MNSRGRYRRNIIFAGIYSYYNRQLKQVELRKTKLQRLLAQGKFNTYIRHAGRFAGRQPSLHIESGLLKRVRKAGYSKYIQQFGKFTSEDYTKQLDKAETLMTTSNKFAGDKRKLLEATERVFNACSFPKEKFQPTSVNYAAANQINRRSSSGYPFYQRKGIVMNKLIRQTRSLKNSSSIWFWPQTRGFRIQLRNENKNIVPKIRVMYPYPGALILLEDTFIIPFVKHFIENETFYIIGKTGKDISKLLKSRLEKAIRILSSDVKSFDQNMLNETIIAAFSIIRMQLKLTKQQAHNFENMVSYFCTSLMVSKVKGKPSYGFVKLHGVPSGSGFTNMIGTLAHAIVLEYLEPDILKRCLICGDDNIVALKRENIKTLFTGYEQVFNLPISIEKTDVYRSSKRISFLGFTWNNYVRLVDTQLVINQMLWHTDFLIDLDVYERELARGASVLLNGANGRDIFKRIFPDVIKQLKNGVDVRFTYLFGYQPPTRLPGVTSYTKLRGPVPNTNQSLIRHLNYGWLIR